MIEGTRTHRQQGDLISLVLFFKIKKWAKNASSLPPAEAKVERLYVICILFVLKVLRHLIVTIVPEMHGDSLPILDPAQLCQK
jgi:hypothetical protein